MALTFTARSRHGLYDDNPNIYTQIYVDFLVPAINYYQYMIDRHLIRKYHRKNGSNMIFYLLHLQKDLSIDHNKIDFVIENNKYVGYRNEIVYNKYKKILKRSFYIKMLKLFSLLTLLVSSVYAGIFPNPPAVAPVLTFAFQNVTPVSPLTAPDFTLSCWTDVLKLTQTQIGQFYGNALSWYATQFGVDVSTAFPLPDAPMIYVIPGYGLMVPLRFDSNYRVVATDEDTARRLSYSEEPLLTACNLVLAVNASWFPSGGLNYGGVYGNYLTSRGLSKAIADGDNLVYGAYGFQATVGNTVCTKQVILKAYIPLINDKLSIRTEYSYLNDIGLVAGSAPQCVVLPIWGNGWLFGNSMIYVDPSTFLWNYKARATWTFGQLPVM